MFVRYYKPVYSILIDNKDKQLHFIRTYHYGLSILITINNKTTINPVSIITNKFALILFSDELLWPRHVNINITPIKIKFTNVIDNAIDKNKTTLHFNNMIEYKTGVGLYGDFNQHCRIFHNLGKKYKTTDQLIFMNQHLTFTNHRLIFSK